MNVSSPVIKVEVAMLPLLEEVVRTGVSGIITQRHSGQPELAAYLVALNEHLRRYHAGGGEAAFLFGQSAEQYPHLDNDMGWKLVLLKKV